MIAENIKKFASDACTVIDAYQQLVGEQEKEISGLKAELSKKASAPVEPKVETKVEAKPTFDAELLQKAASAVHTLYGSPDKVSVQAIADAWSAKPDLMLNVISKFASEITTRTNVSGVALGEPIAKKASATVDTKRADDIFKAKYNY